MPLVFLLSFTIWDVLGFVVASVFVVVVFVVFFIVVFVVVVKIVLFQKDGTREVNQTYA